VTRTLWLCRHGQRRDDVDPEWAATAERPHDPPITDHGRWQARRVGDRLADAGVDAIYASPYYRTVETASLVADRLGLPVRLEPGLGEHLNPAWFDAAPERRAPESLAAAFDPVTLDHAPVLEPTYPETGAEAAARATETARRLVEGSTDGTVLLVGHGLTVGGVATGLTAVDRVETPTCGLCRLDRRPDGGWDLALAADTTHLA
jgi:broad specificity phosphatase PhoE